MQSFFEEYCQEFKTLEEIFAKIFTQGYSVGYQEANKRATKLHEQMKETLEHDAEAYITPANLKLQDTDLPLHTVDNLRCAGIHTLSDLRGMDDETLLSLDGIAYTSLDAIHAVMAKYGMKFF